MKKLDIFNEKKDIDPKLARLQKKYARAVEMKGPGGPGPGGPGRGAMKAKGKPKNMGKTMKRLLSYLKGDTWKIILVFFCVALAAGANLAGTYILRPVINDIEEAFKAWNGVAGADKSAIIAEAVVNLAKKLALMACIYIVGIACTYLQQRIMIGISQKALKKMRDDLFSKLQKLPVRYYDTNSHGELMSRFTNDVDAAGEMITNTLIQLFSGVITIIGTFSLMVYTNIWLTIITVVMMPVIMKLGTTIASKSRKHFSGQQAALGALNGYVEEIVTGQKVVKVFCHEDKCIEEFDLLNDDLREKQVKAQFFGGIMGPVMGNLNNINYAITVCVGAVLCIARGFDIGGLTIFTNYSRQFNRPINEIAMQMTVVFSALAGAERVFAAMDEAPEMTDAENAIRLDKPEGHVIFNNVSFGYNPDKLVLKNISLYAKPGQKIAFVGSTGAGKTTITNLLTRFYDIEEGTITIDGHNIMDIERENLRENIAMVLQDTHLFTGTIRENIRYGRLDATDEEVVEAAKIASAHSFIKRLSDGYDTMIEGDGANLSQGQRQLLNIARAAISKAPILVLDEATSSVDTRTEKQIEKGMDRIMATRTTFVIAHRLSTVRNSNAIMVLEHGEIIERGTHEELLELKGRYYSLYTGAVELD